MKKRILYLFCLSILSVPVLAQIPRATSMIGGSLSLSHSASDRPSGNDSKSTSFGVQPDYGLFVIDNLCIGAAAGFDTGKAEDDATITDRGLIVKARSFSAGPFVRYYLPITDKLYPFAHAGYSWQWSRTESGYTPTTGANATPVDAPTVDKTKTTSLTLGVGLSYFLNPNIALEAALSYSRDVYKDTDPDNIYTLAYERNTNRLGLSFGLQIFLRKSE